MSSISKYLLLFSTLLFIGGETRLIYQLWYEGKNNIVFYDPNIEPLGYESSIISWQNADDPPVQLHIKESTENQNVKTLFIDRKAGLGWSGVEKKFSVQHPLSLNDSLSLSIKNSGPPMTIFVKVVEKQTVENPVPEEWMRSLSLESNQWKQINLPFATFELNTGYQPTGKTGNQKLDLNSLNIISLVFSPNQEIHLWLSSIQFTTVRFSWWLTLVMINLLLWWSLINHHAFHDRIEWTNSGFWPEWGKLGIYLSAIAVSIQGNVNLEAFALLVFLSIWVSVFRLKYAKNEKVKTIAIHAEPWLVAMYLGFGTPQWSMIPVLLAAHTFPLISRGRINDLLISLTYYLISLLLLKTTGIIQIQLLVFIAGFLFLLGFGFFTQIQIRNALWEGKHRDLQKFMEQQMLYSQKIEAIGQLAGGIAHEFNNLLTIIIGNLTLLQIKSGPECANSIKNANVAAKRAANLVEKLLHYSRMIKIEREPIQLNRIVEECFNLFQENLNAKIQFDAKLEVALPEVSADPMRLKMVLINLLMNARDAVEERLNHQPQKHCGIFMETGIERVDAYRELGNAEIQPGSYAVITVSDDGIGIPKENMRKIFDPFFTTKEVGKGTGLGLAACFGIIQEHQGWIHVESEPDKGTRFRVYIPVVSSN